MFFQIGQKRPAISREQSLLACPEKTPVLRAEADGSDLRVTVQCRRPRWQALLGAQPLCEHTFALDALGREVYAACDGRTPVAEIIRAFAARRRVSEAEAELSVTQYLRTLMMRGLVTMRMLQ